MATFTATYTNARGQERQLQVEASSVQQAKRDLRRRGLRVTSVEPLQGGDKRAGIALSPAAGRLPQPAAQGPATSRGSRPQTLGQLLEAKPGIRQKAIFASKLSALVSSGVPIVRSLSLMTTQQKHPMFKRALEGITADVTQGTSLATALRRWPKVFDRLSIAMVEAGETGGVLDETLKRLAKLIEDNARLQNQIIGAMGYPSAVIIVALLVFIFMMYVLIPNFANIYKDLGSSLPVFTQLMLDFSQGLRDYSLAIVGVIGGAVILLGRYYTTKNGRRQLDSLLLKSPLFGDLLQKTATAQFARTFSSLSRAGVPILLSMEITQETTNNSVISDAIKASRNDVLEGIPLSVALSRKSVFPEMAVSMMATGEETGQLDSMLSKIADFYEDEVATAVKTMTSLLEPAMIVIVGLMVGSVLVAMYMPMFSIYDKIR